MGMSVLTPEQCEMALLGSMMLNREALKYGLARVRQRDFSDPRRRSVFEAMEKLNREGKDVDLAILGDMLCDGQETSVPLMDLIQLGDSVPTTAHAPAYARRVRAGGILRELRLVCESTMERCGKERSAEEILQAHSAEVRRLTEEASGIRQERFDLEKAFGRACDLLEEQAEPKAHFPFGLKVLDEAFSGGALPGELFVIGGFPGSGKTSLALWVMRTNLDLGHKCLFLSYEMREGAVIHRFFSQELGIPSSRLRGGRGKLSPEKWRTIEQFCNGNSKLPLIIIDDVSLRLTGIESLVEIYRPQVVFLDYLQLVRGEGKRSKRRYEIVEELMTGLVHLAHRTGVAILLLSQLRKPEGDTEPVPRLHLLKDSSSIEQSANAVVLVQIYRSDVGQPQFSLAVAKNRSGPLVDWTPAYFDAATFRFGTQETRRAILRQPEALLGAK